MGLIYTDIHRYDNITFDEYRQLPGVGHSFLKAARNGIVEDFTPSSKMNLGSLVDNILTDSIAANMADPLYEAAKVIAGIIQANFGQYLQHMHKQVSYTANVKESESGLTLAVTGRLDYQLGNIAVLDLKVTDEGRKSNPVKSLLDLIEFMGYDNQLIHYGSMARCLLKYILIYSKPLKAAFLFKRLTRPEEISKSEQWWTDKIIEHGSI